MDEQKNLTAINLLAIQQAKGRLETLDAEVRGRHVAVVDQLEDNEELEHKQAILNDHDDKVTYITVHLDHLTNREDTSVSVKLEKARHNNCYKSVQPT